MEQRNENKVIFFLQLTKLTLFFLIINLILNIFQVSLEFNCQFLKSK